MMEEVVRANHSFTGYAVVRLFALGAAFTHHFSGAWGTQSG
jgi:hypothetical protein